MEKQALISAQAPKAIGPYSQGIKASPFLFVSGQTPIVPATGKLVSGDVAEQTRQCLANVAAVLAAAGVGLDRVVKTTVFLMDMADFATMNGVYAESFTGVPPARSTVAVAGLPLNARVEIEAIALADE